MRTRFLTPDYFNTNQTVTFLRLPLPTIQSPLASLSSFTSIFEDELLRCIDSPAIAVSLQLQSFPIENALSKFFSDVLPHTMDAGNGVSPIAIRHSSGRVQVPEKGTDLAYEESATVRWGTSNSEREDRFSEESIQDSTGGKKENKPVIIQFEPPELSQHLEDACSSEKIQFLSQVQEYDDNMELLNMGIPDPYHDDIKDSVEAVNAICLEYDMEKKPQIREEAFRLLNDAHTHESIFPLLEVDEIGMEDSTWHCLEDELHTFFEKIEVQHCTDSEDLEQLGAMEINILEHIDDDHASKLPLDFLLESLNLTLDIDIIQVVGTSYIKRNTGTMDAYLIPFVETFLFEEFEMLGPDPFEIFEADVFCHVMKQPETCNQLFSGDTNFKGFDELIVECELANIDGTFTSLPIPVFVDDEKTLSLHVIIADILSELEPVPFSTSDEIYLDWHLLGRDKCNVLAAIEKVFSDIEDSTIDSNLKPNDVSMLVLDFLLLDDPLDRLSIREDKLDMTTGGSCIAEQQNNGVASRRSSDDDCQIIENVEELTNADSEKVKSGRSPDDDCQILEIDGMQDGGDFGKSVPYFESTSHFNDLDFFLNPTKATSSMKIDQCFSGHLHKKEVASLNVVQMQRSGIQFHMLSLPDNIMILIDNLQRSYLAIFKDAIQLNETEFFIDNSNNMTLLGLSEEKLIDHMSRSSKRKFCMGDGDDSIMNLVTLCAIKRMAWCLCFCGIYNLHLFVYKLFQSLDCLKSRLCSFHSLIDDAYGEVDKEIINSHPALSIIKGILQQDISRKNKVLILGQQFLWGPLKKLLTSMDISFIEVEDRSICENQQDLCSGFFDAVARDHLQTACLLLPHERISSSILMQKFDIILEYGGPSGLSKVSSLYPKYIGSRSLHFLKIELDDVAKALCEGVAFASNNKGTIKLEDLLNFRSFTDNCILVSTEAAGSTRLCSTHRPVCHFPRESEPIQRTDVSFPDIIIIVNTQNFDKEMIISRRSTYQKILSVEKRGGQVVERDLILPVDIVVDATKCIAWYDCKNIGMKATAQDEGSSNIPLCVENIAANVLTSLSFTFTTCVLIFEGESNFLGTIMESADELYAAAASLGISLQIFTSYSFELTDEIILSSIGHAMKFSKGLLPRLPESETIAESFLTKFPSINPISAHTIISTGCMPLEFLELSGEARIHALKKYNVPDESINLLSVLCKYGEREESKSGVTDCSSSVSSPPDSGSFVHKINSEDRKRKFIPSSSDAMYDFKCSKQSSENMDVGWDYQSTSRPLDAKVSKSPMIYPKVNVPDLLDDELFGQGDIPDSGTNKDPSKTWCIPNVTQMRDGFAQSTTFSEDDFFNQQKSRIIRNKRQQYGGDILEDPCEDFIGEVVDIHDKPLLGGDFQTAEKSMKFSPFANEMVNDHAPKYIKTARRLSFGTSSYLNFSLDDETDTRCGPEDNRPSRVYDGYNGVSYNWSTNSFKPQKEELSSTSYGETPLSKAIKLGQLQQGSPWTIEFLNRIKEKRKSRQQHQPRNASVPRSSYHGNTNIVTKRRSPSILEYYKYEGGSTPRKAKEQKRQKQLAQPVNEKPSGYFPTWTPIDKKARRTLSFASGTGSQTKLVWRENISFSQNSGFYS